MDRRERIAEKGNRTEKEEMRGSCDRKDTEIEDREIKERGRLRQKMVQGRNRYTEGSCMNGTGKK